MFCSYFQVEKLVAAKVERAKNYRTLVNFSKKEMKEVNSQALPLNSTLWRLHKPTCWLFTKLGWFSCLKLCFLGKEIQQTTKLLGLAAGSSNLNVNNIVAKILIGTIFSSRKEGVTVGGLSLAASYMAQVKIVHWPIFSLFLGSTCGQTRPHHPPPTNALRHPSQCAPAPSPSCWGSVLRVLHH